MMDKRLILSVVLCVGVAGCNGKGQLKVWVADEMTLLTELTSPTNANSLWDAKTRTVKLFSAANETISFQLVIDTPPGSYKKLSVKLNPLIRSGKGRISTRRIKLYKMLPVRVDRFPAWYLRLTCDQVKPMRIYDILLPANSHRKADFDIPKNGRLAIWVDVEVPRTALPGDYKGLLGISTGRIGGEDIDINILLKVYDFVLPDMNPIICIGGFSHEAIYRQFIKSDRRGQPVVLPMRLDPKNPRIRKMLIIMRQLMRLAHRHRLDLFDRTLHPILKRDMYGAVVLDWADYDDIVVPYLDGSAFEDGIGVSAWPLPWWVDGSDTFPKVSDYGGIESNSYRQTVAAILSKSIEHFDEIGFTRQMFLWPRRTLLDSGAGVSAIIKAYQTFIKQARLARTAGVNFPILSTLPPRYAAPDWVTPPEQFEQLADIYAPAADMVDLEKYKSRQSTNEKMLSGLWLQPEELPYMGSFSLLASPADIRVLPWIALKYRCSGIFIPSVLDWSTGGAKSSDDNRNCLFYPASTAGTDVVLPSVRLKRLRRGLQDVGYLWLLNQRRRLATARTLINTMVHYAGVDTSKKVLFPVAVNGWVREGRLWSKMRKILAEEVLSAVHPERFDARRALAQQIAWQEFQRQVCTVRVERVIARVDKSPEGQFLVKIIVMLYNELTTPAEVELQIKTLPAGWQAVIGAKKCIVQAGKRARVELSAQGQGVPTGPDAKMKIPLVMRVDIINEQKTFDAYVPLIVAGMYRGKISIDADLSDWPIRSRNAAGNFISLGNRGKRNKGLARRQTIAFVLTDGENLYLAFRCDEPTPDKLYARSDNIIRYDQFLARDEDIVEVIFDPGRLAREPADLYHLIVKSNGIVVAERGIGAFPGSVRPWSVRIKSAVKKYNGLWIVELAIPLKSFGAKAKSSLWGINFTRFSTIDKEASSWTGCKGYFYDLSELGTLFISPAAQQIKTDKISYAPNY
ncbi:MAG: hypothetical protein J7L99_03305 [Planctomycetes bacterium]|nr:hypothetical protein [Planctomycetota bacterium]